MRSLSMTGGPKYPPASSFLLLAVLAMVLFLHGCAQVDYKPAPECIVTPPPKGEQFEKANPDERLVLMTSAYTNQVKSVANCNADIRLVNAANKATVK